MKTFRESATSEDRRAIALRGGAGNRSLKLFEPKHILSGRRLRRAARSGARIEVLVVSDDAAARRPTIAVDVDPYTRAILAWRIN